jgi:hypothetical protein
MRPSRIWAIARQDWRSELKGRQGFVLPAVIAGLLLPASAVPSPVQSVTESFRAETVVVSGDVPQAVAASRYVVDKSRWKLRFEQQDDGVLLVKGPFLPPQVRTLLDGPGRPAVEVHDVYRGYVFPGRTLLLALITASTLTGAVSESVGGERSRKTLVVLLAAAISKAEIVLGKWVAWGGLGAAASMVAATIACLAGNVQPGLWLVPLPWVPLCTVAVGFWLVRRAGDVMAGSATTLRVLPAALSITGVIAWLLGDNVSPWLGACVPLGGALIAAGDTWNGLGPPLVATASTVGLTVAALVGTIRDLEESSDREPPEPVLAITAGVALVGGLVWWTTLAGAELWRLAGNPRVTEALEPSDGLVAGAVGLLLFTVARAARSTGSIRADLGLRTPRATDLAAGLVGAVALALGTAAASAAPRRARARGGGRGRRRAGGGRGRAAVPRLAAEVRGPVAGRRRVRGGPRPARPAERAARGGGVRRAGRADRVRVGLARRAARLDRRDRAAHDDDLSGQPSA